MEKRLRSETVSFWRNVPKNRSLTSNLENSGTNLDLNALTLGFIVLLLVETAAECDEIINSWYSNCNSQAPVIQGGVLKDIWDLIHSSERGILKWKKRNDEINGSILLLDITNSYKNIN